MQGFSLVFLIVAVALPAESMLLGLGYARLLAWTATLAGPVTLEAALAALQEPTTV